MRAAVSKSKPTTLGRPRTSALTRTEQLRPAKRAQRERDAKAEKVEVRLKLPRALAQRLALAARQPGFVDALTHLLESQIIDADDYPELKLLCWNRRGNLLSAEDAWRLYERNSRFVEFSQLNSAEKKLIARLSARFGGRAPHA